MKPKVSVLITCFDLGEFLHEAVDSVLAQSFRDFEVLIGDDGSAEPETVRILDGFSRPNTTVFRRPHQGLASTRNFLIAQARGEYVCALDCDDLLLPDFLQRTVAALAQDPGLAFASTHVRMFGVETGLWPHTDRCDLAALLAEDTVATAALVRRDAVLSVGGYDSTMPHQGDEDWDLWLSLVERGYRGTILPDVLFLYRRRRGSMIERCTRGQVHLELVDYLVQKHQHSYEQHVLEVLDWKATELGRLMRANAELEFLETGYLREALALKERERRSLEMKLRDVATRREAISAAQQEAARSRSEAAALRHSWSWRVTAPLRWTWEIGRRLVSR